MSHHGRPVPPPALVQAAERDRGCSLSPVRCALQELAELHPRPETAPGGQVVGYPAAPRPPWPTDHAVPRGGSAAAPPLPPLPKGFTPVMPKILPITETMGCRDTTPCSTAASSSSPFFAFLGGDEVHDSIVKYFNEEQCTSLETFRFWVNRVEDWDTLLQGDRFSGLRRHHVAHVKRCWWEAWHPESCLSDPKAPPGGLQHDLNFYGRAALDEASFWKDIIQECQRPCSRTSRAMSCTTPSEAGAIEMAMMAVGLDHLQQLVATFDEDGSGTIDADEMYQALTILGFTFTRSQVDRILRHVSGLLGRADVCIDVPTFAHMIKWLRLAELFTPGAAALQHEALDSTITAFDYCARFCYVTPVLSHNIEEFFFSSDFPGVTKEQLTRWVHFDCTEGTNEVHLMRLALKYGIHPLTVEVISSDTDGTRVDLIDGRFVIALDMLGLSCDSKGPGTKGEPKRVRISRNKATLIMPSEQTHNTVLVSIHQESSDTSAWLKMWRPAGGEVGQSSNIFYDLQDDLRIGGDVRQGVDICRTESLKRGLGRPDSGLSRKSGSDPHDVGVPASSKAVKRLRSEPAEFLLYEILKRSVTLQQPITEAYAARLGWMHQQCIAKLPDKVGKAYLDEIALIKTEVYDVIRSVRPMKNLIQHLIDDGVVSKTTCMWLEEVCDIIESNVQDMDHLTIMAETLETSHKQFREKTTNDTLFYLSTLSGIFLPLQFVTGWYGMNFDEIPELHSVGSVPGYTYFLCLVGSIIGTVVSVVFFVLLRRFWRSWDRPLPRFPCGRLFGRSERVTTPDVLREKRSCIYN